MAEQTRFDFGKKYAILEYKVSSIQNRAFGTSGLSLEGDNGFTLKLSIYNENGAVINTSSVNLPLEALIDSAHLNLNSNSIDFDTVGGDVISCDISELIEKVNTIDGGEW